MSTNVKKRNWCFVAYPESVPSDWLQRLQLSGLQFAVSPLHDKDLDPTGEPKKPHYHVIVVYGNTTTFNNVKSLTNSLNCPIPQALEQVRGYYRYFTHMDNPDKYQYDSKDIRCFNGFDISDFIEMTKSEVLQKKLELQGIIRNLNICEYKDFIDYVQDNLDMTYYDIACSNTIFFNTYIKSAKFKALEENHKSSSKSESE